MSLTPEEFTFERQEKVMALLRGCENAVKHGISRMVIVKRSKRPPKNFDAWRVMPGVVGRVIGSRESGSWLVSVDVADIVKALEKVMRV